MASDTIMIRARLTKRKESTFHPSSSIFANLVSSNSLLSNSWLSSFTGGLVRQKVAGDS